MDMKETANKFVAKSKQARPAGNRNTKVISGQQPQMAATAQKKNVVRYFTTVLVGPEK